MTRLKYLDGISTRMDGISARMDGMTTLLGSMMIQINTQFRRVLDRVSAIRQDSAITKGHFINALQENLILSQRITKIEEELRDRRGK